MSPGTAAVCHLCGDEFELPEYYTIDADRFACEKCGGADALTWLDGTDEKEEGCDD